MKKLLLLLSCSLLLAGCSDIESPILIEETPKLYDVDKKEGFEYELTPKNTAYFYNEGIVKLVSYAEGGDCFTYMIPTFHDYTQIPVDTHFKSDAYLKIESAKKQKDIEASVDNVVYTFRYVTKEQYLDMQGSLLLSELVAECPTLDSYEGSKSYEEFKESFIKNITERVKVKPRVNANVVLYGEEVPSSAKIFDTYYVKDDVEYALPMSTYFFDLASGNYLCLHIHVEGLTYPDLYNYVNYKEDLNKDLLKQLDVYNEEPRNLDDLAENIISYVLVGDFSEYYVKEEVSTSVWERIDLQEEITTEVSTFEEVEDFFTDDNKILEEEVIPDEETQLDYNTDIQDYFQEQ